MTRWPSTALAVAALVVLSSCGGDDEKKANTEPPGTSSAEITTAPTGGAGSNEVKLAEIGTFDTPVYLTSEPDNAKRLFVVEQPGRIRVVEDGEVTEEPFLDITDEVGAGGERGLLSVAFAPDYAKSKKFYVYFTDKGGDIHVKEFQRSADAPALADKDSGRDLLKIEHSQFENHNGGQLQFGPDGLLYAGTGDGGGAGNTLKTAQDRGSLLGKILRIDPKRDGGRPYSIPKDNPFAGESGARGEIYSLGLRNPFRFSFDRESGDLAIGDVGQDEFEEVDFVERGKGNGANFGWSAFEARERFDADSEAPGHVPPVIVRQTRGEGGDCSVIGGYISRGKGLGELAGQYVYGDYCNPKLRVAKLATPEAKDDRELGIEVPQLSSFGEDADGTIYAVSNNGPVYRLERK